MTLQEVAERLKTVSDTPLMDARLLMAHAKGNLEELIERRLKHEPVSKIIGCRGFWKDEFLVTHDVLDPRPDSETVIDAVCQCFPDKLKAYRILDIGTGSGCLLFSLLDEYNNAVGVGIDQSREALSVAQHNQKSRSAELLQRDFMQPDWYQGLGQFDIIVSNPPYIPTADVEQLSPDVREYDPKIALDGGKDGLDAYRALATTVASLLTPNGTLFLEVGINQSEDVKALFEGEELSYLGVYLDYGGVERVLSFRKVKKSSARRHNLHDVES